ncbi:MAG: hypothetical protein H5T83_02895 [Actinotalea sp.]|nr:hypothetical protein [Actinotalea sp.]
MARFTFHLSGAFTIDLERVDPGLSAVQTVPDLPTSDEYALALLADTRQALHHHLGLAAQQLVRHLHEVEGLELTGDVLIELVDADASEDGPV